MLEPYGSGLLYCPFLVSEDGFSMNRMKKRSLKTDGVYVHPNLMRFLRE